MPTHSSPKAIRPPLAGDIPLANVIDRLTHEGELYSRLPDNKVSCWACAHRCTLKPGARGICQVRYNMDGRLVVPWGYVAALNCDPTEKKPFFHIYPGSRTLTFGMLGCDMHCPYCQNWDISQALRDAQAGHRPYTITPQQIVNHARQYGALCIASSYNEPLITSEWAVAVFKESKAAGLVNMFVSNGNATREALEYIRPYTDGYKIDLKSMQDRNYRVLGAVLGNVLDAIHLVHQMGFWLEIVTLVVPGFNDSDDELQDMARFIRSVSPDIPWHVTAFHKDYRMRDPENTHAGILRHAANIGYAEGLHFVYAGNLPGQLQSYEDTRCPTCQTTLIRRRGFHVLDYQITDKGKCPSCHTSIPGIWSTT